LGFGQGVRLIAFEEEEVVAALPLGDLTTVGFDRMGGIANDGDPGQIQVRQMGRHRRFFVGVAGDGNLIDQTLLGRLKIDQRQGFFRFGLLQVQRRIQGGHRGRQLGVLGQSGGCGLGVLEHLPIQMQDADRFGIQARHPRREALAQLLGRDGF
jgi:hypothetical protein